MTDRIVVVTGGAVGIGRATALAFGGLGDHVNVIDIDEDGGLATTALLERGTFLRCDVTSEDEATKIIDSIGSKHGRIDVLVNNAGGFPSQLTSEETGLDEWNTTIDLNLTSVFLVTRASLPYLRRSEAGRVINVGSLAGHLASYRTAPAYAAAKAGVHALTRVLATELAADAIIVNALSPSAVLTDRILELRNEEERRATAASIPLGRYQTPEELAQWVVFLASEEAGFMTGQTVSVNGGRFMG
jgi:3-oxoacyl-[acyl-carrier protein] reductase